MATEQCAPSGTPFKTCPTTYIAVSADGFLRMTRNLKIVVASLNRRRAGCRLAGLGRGIWPDQKWSAAVMSLRCEDVIRVVIPPPPAQVATFAVVPIDAVSRRRFFPCER